MGPDTCEKVSNRFTYFSRRCAHTSKSIWPGYILCNATFAHVAGVYRIILTRIRPRGIRHTPSSNIHSAVSPSLRGLETSEYSPCPSASRHLYWGEEISHSISGRTWISWIVESALDNFCDMISFPWTETRRLVSQQCEAGKLPIQDIWELGTTTLTSQPTGVMVY